MLMYEEKIKWIPQWYKYTEGVSWILTIIIFWMSYFADSFMLLYLFTACLLISIGMAVLGTKSANVKYDRGNIDFEWLFYHKKISLSEVKGVCWNTRKINYRFHSEIRLYLYFELENNYRILGDIIDEDDLNTCLNGKCENIPLMRIYKFYENEYPEKAKGLRTENDKW